VPYWKDRNVYIIISQNYFHQTIHVIVCFSMSPYSHPSFVTGQISHHITVVTRCIHQNNYDNWHLQLRIKGFCYSKVLLPAYPCQQQLVQPEWGEDARVLFNSVASIHHYRTHCRCFWLSAALSTCWEEYTKDLYVCS